MVKNHISYSELKDYVKCPYYHKLKHIDNVECWEDNLFACFGTAIHAVAEQKIRQEDQSNCKDLFEIEFLKVLKTTKKKNPAFEIDADFLEELRAQGRILAPLIIPALREHFGEFEVLSTEEEFYESIKGLKLFREYNYKGFIDLVIHVKKDNKIIILDYKTTTAGWWGRDRSDKMRLYQLIYYKHFYSEKYKVDLEDIETYFYLLKRVVKKDHCELYKITSGKKRIDNALFLLEKTVNNILIGKSWKNRKSCDKCPFNDTKFCSGNKK